MAKKDKAEMSFDIKDTLAILSENGTNDWVKAVDRISWNGRPPTIDIRKRNVAKPEIWPSGISLTDEEADTLTDILLDNDYGSMEVLERSLKKKRSRFTVSTGDIKDFDDEEPLVVKINTEDD